MCRSDPWLLLKLYDAELRNIGLQAGEGRFKLNLKSYSVAAVYFVFSIQLIWR